MSTSQGKPFFPVFLDLSEKKVAVVGGGSIAERRILTLSGFVGSITVIAPEVTDAIRRITSDTQQAPVTWIAKSYERTDIMDADLVLACTDDPDLNNDIYVACKCLGIMVNDCSDKNKCDFYFPSVVQKDGIVVGINAGGTDHHRVKAVRQRVEEALECKTSLYSDDQTDR